MLSLFLCYLSNSESGREGRVMWRCLQKDQRTGQCPKATGKHRHQQTHCLIRLYIVVESLVKGSSGQISPSRILQTSSPYTIKKIDNHLFKSPRFFIFYFIKKNFFIIIIFFTLQYCTKILKKEIEIQIQNILICFPNFFHKLSQNKLLTKSMNFEKTTNHSSPVPHKKSLIYEPVIMF